MRETPFADVEEETEGFLEITYAKNRGILDDAQTFRPDDALLLGDALLWVYRSRNIRELPDMQRSDLTSMHTQYTITDWSEDRADEPVSTQTLLALMQKLDTLRLEEVHHVSFYGEDFHGGGTAFGDTFDMHAMTAAHRSFPPNTMVKVTNVENGKHIVVRINDRGPYIDGRSLDLSKAAFEKIAPLGQGILQATIQRLGDQDLIDQCSDMPKRYYRRITRDVRFHRGLPHTIHHGESVTLGSTRFFVVRSVQYPDGFLDRRQQWIDEKERYNFTPVHQGEHVFHISTGFGRSRTLPMNVLPPCEALDS